MMKSTLKIISWVFVFIPLLANSQSNLNFGKKHTIHSSIFNSIREIQIYTPDGYEVSNKPYPVVYLLDGQRWYLQAASNQRLFQDYGYAPDFIVVGISTNDSGRYGFFNNSEKLIALFEQDIIPYVEKHFNVSNERIIFGWQFAGAFVIKALIKHPELFDGYIAASPIPISSSVLENSSNILCDKSLFIVSSHVEDQVNDGLNDLINSLDSLSCQFNWKHQLTRIEPISSFGHRTTPISALYHGLRFFYNDYPVLEFDEIDKFHSSGAFENVQSYYDRRARKYGLSREIPQEGMFFLLRLGLEENDYSIFKKFMLDFKEKGVLDHINLGWGTRYAEFSLSNKDFSLAESIYKELMNNYPDEARPINGLGKVYSTQGKTREAKKMFKSAIEIAKSNNDRRLAQYQADYDSLKN